MSFVGRSPCCCGSTWGDLGVRDNFQEAASKLNLNGQKEMPDETAAGVQAEWRAWSDGVKVGKAYWRQLSSSELQRVVGGAAKVCRVRGDKGARHACEGPSLTKEGTSVLSYQL